MLDEAEKLAEKAKTAIKAALADEDSRYHSVVTFFMEFHRDDVGPDIAAELFPGTDPAKLSFAEMVDFLKLKRFGSLVDDEMDQQVFIMDLSFNPEITDELMVIYTVRCSIIQPGQQSLGLEVLEVVMEQDTSGFSHLCPPVPAGRTPPHRTSTFDRHGGHTHSRNVLRCARYSA